MVEMSVNLQSICLLLERTLNEFKIIILGVSQMVQWVKAFAMQGGKHASILRICMSM